MGTSGGWKLLGEGESGWNRPSWSSLLPAPFPLLLACDLRGTLPFGPVILTYIFL